MSERLPTGAISAEQKALIEKGLASGLSFDAIRREVLEIGSVSGDDLRDEVDRIGQIVELRRQFKKEGARLMREFVNRVKSGSDVDDMAAMLELAIYRDLLRRYTEDDKALERISMEQLLKLDIRYRMARIACQREMVNGKNAESAKKLYARMLPKIVNKLVSLADSHTAEGINALRGQIMDWAKGEFGRENVEEMEKEEYGIGQIAARIAGEGPGGAGQGEAGHEKAYGLAG